MKELQSSYCTLIQRNCSCETTDSTTGKAQSESQKSEHHVYVHIHILCSFLHSLTHNHDNFIFNNTYVTESQQLYIKYHLWNKINHKQVRKEHNRESAIYIMFE